MLELEQSHRNMSYSKGEMIILGIVFLLLPIVAVVLRIWAKKIQRTSLAWDDYLIFPALVFAVAGAITQVIAAVDGNLGQQQTLAPNGMPVVDHEFLVYQKSKFVLQISSVLSLGFTKASIIMLYARIFSLKWFHRLAHAMLIVTVIWTIGFFFADVLQCNPISTVWTELEQKYQDKCINRMPFYNALAISGVVTDLVILAMPLPAVWTLKLSFRQKSAICGMFLLGTLVCAVGIVRVVIFIQIGSAIVARDTTYFTSPVFFWTVIEMSLAVVSACLPLLRPLFLTREKSGSSFKSSIWPFCRPFRSFIGKEVLESSPVGSSQGLAPKDSASHTHINATQMQNSEHLQEGIMVQKEFSFYAHRQV